ncbi:MAG: DUF302 domain-containing protein [Kiritimatiellia bacterium]
MTLNIILSVVAGSVLMAVLFIAAMRTGMIRRYRMHASFEKVCENVEKAVKSVDGWGHPIPDWNFHEVVSRQHYFDNLKKKKIFFVCKAKYANRIVDKYPHMGAMMPCTWSVYETADGKVYIAKMNIALMSKMFLGNVIGSTMSLVAREEHDMIQELRRLLRERAAA